MKLFAVVAATTAMVASAAADSYTYTVPFAPIPAVVKPDCFLSPSAHSKASSPVDIHVLLPANCTAPAYYKCKSDSIPKNTAEVSIVENAITVTIPKKNRPKYTLPALKYVAPPTVQPPTKAPHSYGYDEKKEDSYDSYDSYDEDDDYYHKRPARPVKAGKMTCELESFRLLAISQHTVFGNHHPLEVELLHTCDNGKNETSIAIVNQFYNVKKYDEPKPTYKKPTKKSYYKKPTKSAYKKDDYVEKYLELNQETYVAPKTEDPYKKKYKSYDSEDEYYSDDDDHYYEDKEIYYKKDAQISVEEWSKEATIILKKIINTVAAQLINVTTEGSGYYKSYTPVVSNKKVPLPFKFKAKFLSYWGKGAYAYNGTTTWTTKPNYNATVFITGHALETDEKVPAFCELVHSLDTKRPYEQYNNRRIVPFTSTRPMWKFCGNNCTQEWENATCPTPVVKPTYKPNKYSYKKDEYKKDDYNKKDDYKSDDYKKDDKKY